MRLEFNVYCDETCHLENDDTKVMALGAVWCPKERRKEICNRIKEIKARHKLGDKFEIKWNKVSSSKVEFYLDLINYFFDDDDLHFRIIIVPDKTKLNHAAFGQTHDNFYYKMYFDLLKVILDPTSSYNIYLDMKDTLGQEKVMFLQNVLRNNHYDFQKQIIQKVQQVNSKEIEVMQITDLLTGAFGYYHRGLKENIGKVKLIETIKNRSKYSLDQSTLPKENKLNIFIWKPREIISPNG